VVFGDVFYFDYGVVVVWGLSPEEERSLVKALVGPALADPLDPSEVEIDGFFFHYTLSEKPHIQNDTFTSECPAAAMFRCHFLGNAVSVFALMGCPVSVAGCP